MQELIQKLKERRAEIHSEVIYLKNFLSIEEADALFSEGIALPFKRKTVQFGRLARHASFEFTAFPTSSNHRPLSEAPPAIASLRERLNIYSGKDINNLSVVRYEDGDFFAPHQHRRDHQLNSDGSVRDATVYIVSTGVARPFATRLLDKKAPAVRIMAEAGSLIVLPASYNVTRTHSVPPWKGRGVRIALNCQHRDE